MKIKCQTMLNFSQLFFIYSHKSTEELKEIYDNKFDWVTDKYYFLENIYPSRFTYKFSYFSGARIDDYFFEKNMRDSIIEKLIALNGFNKYFDELIEEYNNLTAYKRLKIKFYAVIYNMNEILKLNSPKCSNWDKRMQFI